MLSLAMSSLAAGEYPSFGSPRESSTPRSMEYCLRRNDEAPRLAGDLAGVSSIVRKRTPVGARAQPTIVPSRSYSVNDIAGMSASSRALHQGAVESFLLYVSRSLAMDIGELWTLDYSSALRMTKLYIAPNFYDRYSTRILYPDADPRGNPSAQHRHSRELCMKAMMKGDPMWCDLRTSAPGSGSGTASKTSASAAAPAADEALPPPSSPNQLPLRTAVVIPFNMQHSGDGSALKSSATAVLVLYCQRWRPLPSPKVMRMLTEFTRSVATQQSMGKFLRMLDTGLDAALHLPPPTSEAHSVTDRLGLSASASLPACLHELEPNSHSAHRRRSSTTLDRLNEPELLDKPLVAPPAPLMRELSGSTFAQRRMRQMVQQQSS